MGIATEGSGQGDKQQQPEQNAVATRERRRASQQAWYQKNQLRVVAKHRAYYGDNRDHERARSRKYYREHHAAVRARQRQYYKRKNTGKLAAIVDGL
jgi:hypothetical protein